MDQMQRAYFHIFDPLHILKNLRNTILNKEVKSHRGEAFNMHSLNNLRNSADPNTRRKYRTLLPDSPFPSDLMNLSSVHELLQGPLIEELKKEALPSCQELGKYLENMKMFYFCCTDNHMDHSVRIRHMEEVTKYFGSMSNLGTLAEQILVTTKSLQELHHLCQKEGFHSCFFLRLSLSPLLPSPLLPSLPSLPSLLFPSIRCLCLFRLFFWFFCSCFCFCFISHEFTFWRKGKK